MTQVNPSTPNQKHPMFQAVMLAFAAAEQAILLIQKLSAVAKQNAELTPEQEQQIYDRQQALIATATHWQIDPDPVILPPDPAP